jgi:BNR repeat-like domain
MTRLSSRPWASRRLRTAAVAGVAFSLAASGAAYALATATPISTDLFTQATCAANAATAHATEVEPDTYANGSTIVAAFQVGRVFNGGACDIGFATSSNNGATWTSGLLPGITKFEGGGTNDRVSDAAVAFDAKRNVWLISSLTLLETPSVHGNTIATSRSTDGGLTWPNPVTTGTGVDVDKNWIACDDSATSPFFGNCYTEWDDFGQGNLLQMSTSTDGGLTWSAPATNGTGVIGGQPVVRPNGTVVVPIDNASERAIGAFSSTDGGATWSATTTIARINHHTEDGGLRSGALPSAEIDGAGTVYVVWSDCRFRKGCKANDIVISHSLDATGTSWSPVSRVPIDTTTSGIDHFIPGLAVDNATSGATAHLGLTYYDYPIPGCGKKVACTLEVGFVSSADGGATWSGVTPLATPFSVGWAAPTSQGRMVGDYISTSFGSDNLAHGVFVTASVPSAGTNCGDVADQCAEPTLTSDGLAVTGGALSSAGDPVLSSINDTANSLWNIVDNNGVQHRN